MKEVKRTKGLRTGGYNSIMKIFKYNTVTYCVECGAKRYSRYCKCNRLPVKISNSPVIKKYKSPIIRKENGSRKES
jgi:hypothetical protein